METVDTRASEGDEKSGPPGVGRREERTTAVNQVEARDAAQGKWEVALRGTVEGGWSGRKVGRVGFMKENLR